MMRSVTKDGKQEGQSAMDWTQDPKQTFPLDKFFLPSTLS